jgi:flagellar motor protein MotB
MQQDVTANAEAMRDGLAQNSEAGRAKNRRVELVAQHP